MNKSSTNDFSRLLSLNVVVSTDTVLYTPFFLGYYSGEYENTPFGRFSINIIGTQDDSRFIQPVKLKGDGFASFCLIFELADAAICDPSFLVFLSNAESKEIEEEFKKFEELLQNDTKEFLVNKFSSILKLDNKILSVNSPKDLKELFVKRKVLGGIVGKMAFSVVGSADLKEQYNKYKSDIFHFCDDFVKDSTTKDFTKSEVKNSFFYYNNPSTGYCVGEIHSSNYKKTKDKRKYCDFGQELTELVKDQTEKSLAITCDFIALDFLLKNNSQSKEIPSRDIFEVQDLTEFDKNYLFTGIIGYVSDYDDDKLRGLLYVIDKNLFYINKYLDNRDTTGLIKFLRRKFDYSIDKENELLRLLIADEDIRKTIQVKINSKDDPDFNFNQILRYFVERLNNWYSIDKNGNNVQSLYLSSCYPENIEEKLFNITVIRYEAIDKRNKLPKKESFSNYIALDLLSGWRKTEVQYWAYENSINEKNSKPKISDILLFFLAPFLIIKTKWKTYLFNRIWSYLRKPTYLYFIGSFFILFEVITGLSHVFYKHIPNWIPQFIWNETLKNGTINEHIYSFPISLILFFYVILSFSYFFYHARKLHKLKQEEHFMYRT